MPLEEGRVEIARAWGRAVMPSRSIVVGAMNPCPCGHFGDPERECTCPQQRLTAYRSRLSGPLLDRFDLRVEAPRIDGHGPPVRVLKWSRRGSHLRGCTCPSAHHRFPSRRSICLVARCESGGCRGGRPDWADIRRRIIAALADCERVSGDHMAEALSYRGVA